MRRFPFCGARRAQISKGNMNNDDLLNIFTSVLKESQLNSEGSTDPAVKNSLKTFIDQIETQINVNNPNAKRILAEIFTNVNDENKNFRYRVDGFGGVEDCGVIVG